MPKHNRLNEANKKMASLARRLNQSGYGYTYLILGEMEDRKKIAKANGAPQYAAVEWAVAELEERLSTIQDRKAKFEAIKRIDAVVEEYDEAMVAVEAYNEAEGN